MKNQVQLITYPDSLGGDLKSVSRVLSEEFRGTFGGLHILPPFPSTGDRGFAPMSYEEIDPRFGTWDDIHRLNKDYEVMLDFMVNHISRFSPYFADFQKYGRQSAYADMFITLDKVWPNEKPDYADLRKVFWRRPKGPLLDVPLENGAKETVWATFGRTETSEQIDLDVNSKLGKDFIEKTLAFFTSQGIANIRLDAAAFAIKKAGTSCFLVEPEIYTFFDWIHMQARTLGLELLLEIHTSPHKQMELARRGYWVYNFVLPILVLHTIENRSSSALKKHIADCPTKQITNLDTHDGIPVQPDIEGILAEEDAKRIVALCEKRGANVSRIYSEEYQIPGTFDAHQINCTYYSALNCDDNAYIMARALQLFVPGIPQVYYVGLLAGENSTADIELQGDARAINRHNYSLPEIIKAAQKPVVQRLINLMRFRNEHQAFSGEFSIEESDDKTMKLRWKKGRHEAMLDVDLVTRRCNILFTSEQGESLSYDP